jgi:hypothetical protein
MADASLCTTNPAPTERRARRRGRGCVSKGLLAVVWIFFWKTRICARHVAAQSHRSKRVAKGRRRGCSHGAAASRRRSARSHAGRSIGQRDAMRGSGQGRGGSALSTAAAFVQLRENVSGGFVREGARGRIAQPSWAAAGQRGDGGGGTA